MDRMIIGRICFPVTTLGFGNRIGIWTCGCLQNCKGCISPELKDISNGIDFSLDSINDYLSKIKVKIDGVTISGGEPFLQRKELAEYIEFFVEREIDDIIVYSGYKFEYLYNSDVYTDYILKNISVLIDGKYEKNLDDGIGLRGSSNQKIHVFKYKERHCNLEKCDRKIQIFMKNGHMTNIGIPK